MSGAILSGGDRAELLRLMRRQTPSTVHRRMNALLPLDDADKPLYFVDATHPSYTAHPGHGWIRKGQTRQLKSNHGRVNVNINGALRWPERDLVHREAAKITSAEMIKLFDDLRARHPAATAIRVVLDNARYNHSAEIKAYIAGDGCRIELVYLPAYAPNLNLIERLWWLLKKKVLYNEHFPTFAEFKAAVPGFFANPWQLPGRHPQPDQRSVPLRLQTEPRGSASDRV